MLALELTIFSLQFQPNKWLLLLRGVTNPSIWNSCRSGIAKRSLTWVFFAPIVSECSRSRLVNGYVGQNVTLSCSYKSQSKLPACWNRGELTLLGCRNQLISSSGDEVIETTRASSRYQLLGRLDKRDVSLTILNLTEADAGQYSCRVEIPGMFNDKKHLFTLVVKKGENISSRVLIIQDANSPKKCNETCNYRQATSKSKGMCQKSRGYNQERHQRCREAKLINAPYRPTLTFKDVQKVLGLV